MGRTSTAKERLLEAALDLIWSNSFASVSVDDICARADVRKGSFYHFFEGKTELALAAYEAKWQALRPLLDGIFSAQLPPLERLSRWCAVTRQSQRDLAARFGHVVGCPFCNVGSELATLDARLRAKSEEILDRMGVYVTAAIADAQRAHLIRVADVQQSAAAVCAYSMGCLLSAKVHNDPALLDDLEAPLFRLLGVPSPRK